MLESNSARLAHALADFGLSIRASTVVRDELGDIESALALIAGRSRACVVSGGLGPTDDDRTAEAAANAAGVGLVRHEGWADHLRAMLGARGRRLLEANIGQASIPEGAELIHNAWGTAPAFSLELGECRFFFLPGVPSELIPLCDEVVAPEIARAAGARVTAAHTLRTFGLPESEVGRRLEGLEAEAGVTIGYRASYPEVLLTVRAAGEGARDRVEAASAEVSRRMGGRVYATGDTTYSEAVVDALRRAGAGLAVAESCTGGLIGKLLTDTPGSSDVFVGGLMVYSNALKRDLCGVPEAVLEAEGAVSEATARALAAGVRERTGATFGLAVTGIAGPGGGTEDKPVGLVHGCLEGPEGATHKRWSFVGDRARIRIVAAYAALGLVLRALP